MNAANAAVPPQIVVAAFAREGRTLADFHWTIIGNGDGRRRDGESRISPRGTPFSNEPPAMSATVVLPSMPAKCPLPVQSIPRGTSASIEDQNGKLVAHCVLVQCTKGQAYLIVQQMDAVVAPKAVTLCVPNMDKPFDLKISSISDVHPNRMHMPMYIQVHYNPEQRYPLEHLVDLLAETVLGRYNFELRKNLTIDLFDSAANAAIRDGAGFIVSDRHRFQQISVGAKQARAVLAPTNEVLISLVSDDHSELLKYDASLSNHQRADFLNFLIKECKNVLVAHWSPAKLAADAKEKDKENEKESEGKAEQKGEKEEAVNTVAGYLIASSERVLCLYAENSKIADSLLAAHIDRNNQKGTINFCCIASKWDHLRALATLRTRPIYRRHTRVVPSNIKYEKLFAMNVGINIF